VQTGGMDERRRDFLRTMTSAATGAALVGCGADGRGRETARPAGGGGEAEVTPGEDLMQEHGLLERILLVYGEAARRLEGGERFDLAIVGDAADIVRRFVEDYHEKLEERHVFPRLERAEVQTELVSVLRRQHARGREVTEEVRRLARAPSPPGPRLAELLRAFDRMYRPHAAREDTVVFPAFRALVGRAAYRELGEQFEHEEHERLGARGFTGAVAEVARLEEALGIADLAGFTA
jgi:hemerythrin-like domain-containing protein